MEKKGFVFPNSIYHAIGMLSNKNKLIAYEAIMRYAIMNEAPKNLPKPVLTLFLMAQPLLDSNAEKYEKSVQKKKQQQLKSSSSQYVKVSLPRKEDESNDSFD